MTGGDNTCTGCKSEMAIWSVLSALLGWKDGHFCYQDQGCKECVIGKVFYVTLVEVREGNMDTHIQNRTGNVTMTNDQRLLGSNALDEGDKNIVWSSQDSNVIYA